MKINRIKDVPKEMVERIQAMGNHTWEVIGSDILVDDMGKPDYSKNIPRSHVVEIVMDCDNVMTFGNDKEAYEVYKTLSPNLQKRIIKEGFPFKTYGW